MSMRAFHLVNSEHGIQNIRKRRLKIATLKELNDPFDFYGAAVPDPDTRRKLSVAREAIGEHVGLLCFSSHWHNPVLWSHYADKHAGLCLGFEIPDAHIGPVAYATKRFRLQADPLNSSGAPDQESVRKLMFTKYSHWKYESELRMFAPLEQQDPDTQLYFAPFSHELRLVSVIIGALCTLSRDEVTTALGEMAPEVELIKTRLAFQSFRVVPQRNARLWK